MRVPHWVVCVFPGVFLSSRVTGACPVTADLIMRVNVITTTTKTTTTTLYRRKALFQANRLIRADFFFFFWLAKKSRFCEILFGFARGHVCFFRPVLSEEPTATQLQFFSSEILRKYGQKMAFRATSEYGVTGIMVFTGIFAPTDFKNSTDSGEFDLRQGPFFFFQRNIFWREIWPFKVWCAHTPHTTTQHTIPYVIQQRHTPPQGPTRPHRSPTHGWASSRKKKEARLASTQEQLAASAGNQHLRQNHSLRTLDYNMTTTHDMKETKKTVAAVPAAKTAVIVTSAAAARAARKASRMTATANDRRGADEIHMRRDLENKLMLGRGR